MKGKMSEYRDLFAGSPAAVLGGGPSLAGDVGRLPTPGLPTPGPSLKGWGAVLIAVNYHAFHVVEEVDFMVYNDHPASDELLMAAVREHRAVNVSPDPSSDIEFDVPVWTGFYSSNTAAWFALWMGCDPVILCGMDCYQGDQVYCHASDRDVPCFHYPLEHHLRPWVEDGRNLLPHVERLRAMSGPLVGVFGLWKGDHERHEIHEKMGGGI